MDFADAGTEVETADIIVMNRVIDGFGVLAMPFTSGHVLVLRAFLSPVKATTAPTIGATRLPSKPAFAVGRAFFRPG
jgi:hypothetical protein